MDMESFKLLTPFNKDKICRTCLSQQHILTSIYEMYQNECLSAKLQGIFGLKFTEFDGLPSNICNTCIDYIQQANTFKQQIIKSNDVLQKYFTDQINSVEDKSCETYKGNSPLPEFVFESSNDELSTKNNDDIFSTNYNLTELNNLKLVLPVKHQNINFTNDNSLQVPLPNPELKTDEHIKNGSNIVNHYVCDYCNTSFTLKSLLQQHIYVKHVNHIQLTCNICNKYFTTKCQLDKHKLKHPSKKYKCNLCEKLFAYKHSLKHHQLSHQQKDVSQCDECKKTFCNEYQLHRHIKVAHTGETHTCSECKKSFTHKTRLQKHLLCHVKSDMRRLQCQHCPMKFNYIHHLKNHERLHTGLKPFLCNVCGKEFVQLSNLKLHMKQHDKILPHVCEKCKKSFAHPQRLKRHLLTHEEKKKFKCNLCEKCYKDPTNLNKHITNLHNNKIENNEKINENKEKTNKHINKYLCAMCKSTFLSSHRLEDHKKTHISKYKCDICNREFSKSSSLKIHLRFHTQKQLYTCNSCKLPIITIKGYNESSKRCTCLRPTEYDIKLDNPGYILKFEPSQTLKNHVYIQEINEPLVNNLVLKDSVVNILLQKDDEPSKLILQNNEIGNNILFVNENNEVTLMEQNFKLAPLVPDDDESNMNSLYQTSIVKTYLVDNDICDKIDVLNDKDMCDKNIDISHI